MSFIIGLVAINAAKDLGTVSEGLAQEGGYLDIKIKIFKVLYSWSYYFNHLLLPTGQTSMHFDPEIIDGTLPIKYYLSFIPFSLLLVWTALKGLKTRDFVFWCGFYFVTLALVINILPLGGTIVSERYAYLTVIAGAYFIAKILDYYFKPKIRNIISIFFILIFSGITFFTMDIWKYSLSLHKRSFELFPTSAHATASYAKALARNNQAELALKIQKSDPLSLESPEYLVNIANTYFILDSVEKRDSFLEKAILKDLQRHPAKNNVMHADFLRIDEKVAIKVNVPIHFLNEEDCAGVKMEGGMIQHQATDIEVSCLPGDIPEYIEVDMLEVITGQIIHLSEVTLPEGVTSVALSLGEDHDLAIASVVAPKGTSDEDEETVEVEEGETEGEEGDSEE